MSNSDSPLPSIVIPLRSCGPEWIDRLAELEGGLAGMLALGWRGAQRKTPADVSAGVLGCSVNVVAGTGFEPVTFRL